MATHQLKWKPDAAAELRVLGNGAGAAIPVRLQELTGKRMRITAAAAVACGAAVRLDWEGQLVLGVVLEADPDGFWIEIQHMLLDAAGLDWQKQGWHG
ncbi:MAG TPA: hypothetical protein VMI94_22205 [Bryobacteraceae bacterium]|nr:hypothetical protein [Bryobacteraceae bacterium]